MNEILVELYSRFVGINLLNTEMDDGSKRMLTLLMKNGYLKCDSYGNIVRNHHPISELSHEEIIAGQTQGKLDAVKLHRERTHKSLMDCKKTVEDEFSRLGYIFKR